MTVTGFLLWFENSTIGLLTKLGFDISLTVHFYEAVLATGGGEVRIELFADSAPLTVNNFVQLARDGFYDNIVFHRVLAGFMAQAGDPTATGTGNPGYQFADEFESGAAMDRKGLLAMANTGPNTNGSQFFITLSPQHYAQKPHRRENKPNERQISMCSNNHHIGMANQ